MSANYAMCRRCECEDECSIQQAVMEERDRCAKIVHAHQIAFASDACGWALDKIKDGLPPAVVRWLPTD